MQSLQVISWLFVYTVTFVENSKCVPSSELFLKNKSNLIYCRLLSKSITLPYHKQRKFRTMLPIVKVEVVDLCVYCSEPAIKKVKIKAKMRGLWTAILKKRKKGKEEK